MLFPALQDLIYTKVCLEKYSVAVCDDLYSPDNEVALNYTQTGASHWVLASTFSLALPSIITAQFLGSWSDTYGRKIPMLLPPVGAMLSSVVYVVMAGRLHQTPVALVILASLIAGLCGGFTSCIMTCMSYVGQATSSRSRTMRVGVLEGMTFLGGTLGPILGGWVTEAGGRAATFTLILACHAAIIVYIIPCVPNVLPRNPPSSSWFQSGWKFQHLRDGVATIFKSRQEGRRSYLLVLLAAVSIIMICTAGEIDIGYLYVHDKPLKLSLQRYTLYLSFKFGLGAAALLFLLPLASTHLPDTFLAGAGLVSKIAGLLLLGFAWNEGSVFGSGVLSLLSTWPVPIVRAAMSKLVEPGEQGKLFACVAVLENVCTLVASSMFNTLYPITRTSVLHGLIFVLAAVILLLPLVVLCILHKYLKRFDDYAEMDEDAKEMNESEEGLETMDGEEEVGERGELSIEEDAERESERSGDEE
ncbi:hypothetical protein Pcinc_024110 [Petrolisthes cinctipes]|uniref:Major facilitator superfamily (MFS) profile domain-containing protein n=1 Tax=Petrolisthes cinctipes TaxID=88211 RepID=A0AAE1FAK2_PETCI|nr:hypothetical protein Pcinc_024110 [Petrolisthes cinctipes]